MAWNVAYPHNEAKYFVVTAKVQYFNTVVYRMFLS